MSNRTALHATFTLERDYPVPVAKVWEAFADPEVKQQWFGGGEQFVDVKQHEDFAVGGIATNEARFGPDGPLTQFRATYTDIIENERIVYTYDMWLDGVHASTSLATIVFEESEDGTRLTLTEQGVHLDGVHGPGPEAAAGREQGTGDLLDKLGAVLTAAS
jgi:uncharacterized protein YndB with AHSA1/START domain